MELYQQILASHIGSVTIDTQTAKEIVAGDSYKALEKIRAILADDALSDAECFRKIEAIVCIWRSWAVTAAADTISDKKRHAKACLFPFIRRASRGR